MATRNRRSSRAAAATAAGAPGAPASSDEMVFEADAFRSIPEGVSQVVFKVASVGDNQSVSLGVGLFEQATPTSQWMVLAKQRVDNLPTTPEGSFFSFAPKRGARYAITFLGEMHALSLANDPLLLGLAVTADGVGAPLEDFNGDRTVAARFCIARGRALLEAKA